MKPKTLEETIYGLEICSGTIDYCYECPYKTSEEIKGDQTCDEYEIPLMMRDFVYHLKKYKKLIDDMEKMKFIDVNESLPKKSDVYLVYAPKYFNGSSGNKENHKNVMFSKWNGKNWSIEVGYYKRPGCVEKWMEIPQPTQEIKEESWSYAGDNFFRCTQCGELYSVQQFQDMKNHTTDPDFPNYCPHCGSHNYRGKNDS